MEFDRTLLATCRPESMKNGIALYEGGHRHPHTAACRRRWRSRLSDRGAGSRRVGRRLLRCSSFTTSQGTGAGLGPTAPFRPDRRGARRQDPLDQRAPSWGHLHDGLPTGSSAAWSARCRSRPCWWSRRRPAVRHSLGRALTPRGLRGGAVAATVSPRSSGCSRGVFYSCALRPSSCPVLRLSLSCLR